ncbi:MAG: hypothetical protein EB023_12705 [Flavobacteriia bacterium]|nr:hypothetical protein [Flavobacteriia bacterium]
MIGDSYGWEMGYMIVDWKTHIGDGISTVDPDDLETLGKTIDEIACKYAFKLIKIQSNQLGYGNCYFKEINCSTSIIADS